MLKLVGGLSEMRMLMLTSFKRNIRRIGSLQSTNSSPVGEVISVAVVVGDVLSNSDDQEALDGSGSSKHHKLGVFSMAVPTMFSPSSFPHMSNKMLGGEKKKYRKV